MNKVEEATLWQDITTLVHQVRITGCTAGIERWTPDQRQMAIDRGMVRVVSTKTTENPENQHNNGTK